MVHGLGLGLGLGNRVLRRAVRYVHDDGPQATMARTLQDCVKQAVAPYKYPRAVAFVDQLPRTPTGKLQRFRLHG